MEGPARMVRRILRYLLKNADIDLELTGQVATIKLQFAGWTIGEWSFNLGNLVSENSHFREVSRRRA